MPRPAHDDAPRSAAPDITVRYLVQAEGNARAAARLVELDPDPDAQREAAILYRVAQRLRARRLAA